MALRGTAMNFKFFEVLGINDFAYPGDEPDTITELITDSVDTKGFETCHLMWNYSTLSSFVSISEGVQCILQHASNSTTGPNAIGAWSRCSEEHIFGIDWFRMARTITYGSWLVLDELTRDSYAYSIPVSGAPTANTGGAESGCFAIMAMSAASIASLAFATIFGLSAMPWVGYKGPHRWVRMIFSSPASGSIMPTVIAVLGLPADWPVVDMGHPLSHK